MSQFIRVGVRKFEWHLGLLTVFCLFPGCVDIQASSVASQSSETSVSDDNPAKLTPASGSLAVHDSPKLGNVVAVAANDPAEQTGSSNPRKSTSREKELYAAMDDALKLLEQNDVKAFAVMYLPVEEFRRIRDEDALDTLNQQVRGEGIQKLIDAMKNFREQKPTFYKSGLVATLDYVQPADDSKPPNRADTVVNPIDVKGYGDDLQTVIAESIKSLENGDHESFIERMFPIAEARRLKGSREQTNSLRRRFEKFPKLAQQMIADLKLIQARKPEFSESGTVATYRVVVPVSTTKKDRSTAATTITQTFKLQKTDGSWRLFDSSSSVRQEVARQKKLNPSGYTIQMTWEKLGNRWRIFKMPE